MSIASRFINEALDIFEALANLRKYRGKSLENGGSSIRGGVVPAVRKLYEQGKLKKGMTVLDYGAGKYSRNADFLRSKGMKVYAYDPFNYNSTRDGWNMGKVSNRIPSGKFDVGFSSYVLNVIPDQEENKVIKQVKRMSMNEYHIVRDRGSIVAQGITGLSQPRSVGYRFFMEKYATPELKKKLQSGGVKALSEEDILRYCYHGFETKKGSFQRLCDLAEKGFKQIGTSSGSVTYGK
jgi:hypothetical protein